MRALHLRAASNAEGAGIVRDQGTAKLAGVLACWMGRPRALGRTAFLPIDHEYLCGSSDHFFTKKPVPRAGIADPLGYFDCVEAKREGTFCLVRSNKLGDGCAVREAGSAGLRATKPSANLSQTFVLEVPDRRRARR